MKNVALSYNPIKIVAKLRAPSIRWMIERGYVTDDGRALQLTPAGYDYFLRLLPTRR